MIVTLDGPAGAGKSSAARALAQRLDFEYMDTGAMYRAVTLAALRAGIDRADQKAVAELIASLRIELPHDQVFVNNEDITGLIRTAEVTKASGKIADSPAVRRFLVGLQQHIAEGRNMVCEGRDQGTIVFPNALCKFFLVADSGERARRRQQEMAERGEVHDLEAILLAQEKRDRRDAARDLAPMVPAADAIMIDSTHLDLESVVAKMEVEVRRRM